MKEFSGSCELGNGYVWSLMRVYGQQTEPTSAQGAQSHRRCPIKLEPPRVTLSVEGRTENKANLLPRFGEPITFARKIAYLDLGTREERGISLLRTISQTSCVFIA